MCCCCFECVSDLKVLMLFLSAEAHFKDTLFAYVLLSFINVSFISVRVSIPHFCFLHYPSNFCLPPFISGPAPPYVTPILFFLCLGGLVCQLLVTASAFLALLEKEEERYMLGQPSIPITCANHGIDVSMFISIICNSTAVRHANHKHYLESLQALEPDR